MQVWKVLHAARGKCRTQKSRHLGTIPQLCRAISSQLRHISTIGKKLVKQHLYMSPQYGELRPTSGWDRFVSLGHPCKFQLVSGLGSVTARHSSSGRQPNFAALNRGRHLCSAGRPSRWALAHILVSISFHRLISAVADWISTILPHVLRDFGELWSTFPRAQIFNSGCLAHFLSQHDDNWQG